MIKQHTTLANAVPATTRHREVLSEYEIGPKKRELLLAYMPAHQIPNPEDFKSRV